MNEVNSLSIIDQGDMVSFKQTMQKINQWQNLVQSNLKKDKDYGIIPGTSKPTLYKPGAEKIVMLGKLRSTFDILDETKDYEKEFFQFEVRWNLWAGENLICQGVGLCSSKEDKYRYRWVSEKKLPNNIKKENLLWKEKDGKYGKYKVYRIENEDICSIANTILKMAKKRALIDAALLVGSLSELFTQDDEDLPEEYLKNEKTANEPKPEKPDPSNTDFATQPQVNLIKKQIVSSHLLTEGELKKINGYLETGLTKSKASEIIGWWLGDSKNNVTGKRAEREAKPTTTKEDKIKQAWDIVEAPGKVELREGSTGLLEEEEEPGSSPTNAIKFKGKKKALKKVSKAEDFVNESDYIAPEDLPE